MAEGEFQCLKHLQLWQEEEVQADAMRLSRYPCPCMECAGGKILDRLQFESIFAAKKKDPVFTTSILVSDSNKSLLNVQ
jgi:hypothetical protein